MVDLNITLPEGFLDEEVRCGYTVTHEMKELWAVELDLLNEFQRVCSENNLKYFACGGTLLGTVRHKGFIPWDDDIDVAMFREDYEKLKLLGNSVFGNGYFLQSTYTDDLVRAHMQLRKDGTTCFTKNDFGKKHHRGIFIDIFVYDNIPNDDKELYQFEKKLSSYYSWIGPSPVLAKQDSISLKYAIRKTKRVAKKVLHRIFIVAHGGRVKAFHKFETMAQKYNKSNTSRVCVISFFSSCKSKLRIEKRLYFDDIISLPFEFLSMPCPSSYDDLLKIAYGNYMEYVIGGSMHGGLFFDADKSYEYYDDLSYKKFAELFNNC